MFLQIKKLYSLVKFFAKLDLAYDSKNDVYTLSTSSNIMISTDKNILTVSKGDTMILSKNLHLNPTPTQLKESNTPFILTET